MLRDSKVHYEIPPLLEKVYRPHMANVKGRVYPGKEHTVFTKDEDLARFRHLVGWSK